MDEGVIAHVQVGKSFDCKVGDPIMELGMTSHDEAYLLAIKCVTY